MGKTVTTQYVKRQPVLTDIKMVRDLDGAEAYYWVIQYGKKKKMLRSVAGVIREIQPDPGWHFEIRADVNGD